MRLTDSDRYKKDIKNYTNLMRNLVDTSKKEKCQKLLKELQAEAFQIDNGHNSSLNGIIKPKDLRINIERMSDVRRELNELLDNT
tara:strand:+ start:276 stop:530 length:255 start_codon:yes stop_codon:yes gene_type:complete